MLGVSAPTVIKWANDGILQSFRTPGGHRRILESEVQSFWASFASEKKQVSKKSILLFMSDEDYAQLLVEYFDAPSLVHRAQNAFQLAWILAKKDISHIIWDWYENTIEALKILSSIQKEPSLSHISIIGILPLYEQLNPSVSAYFHKKTSKNLALQNLSQWIGEMY